MPEIKLSENTIQLIKDICFEFENKESELINVLHRVQGKLGYLPAEVQEVIAKELKTGVAKVYGVVTFYSFFTMIPQGEFPISICMGTACYVRGAEQVLAEFKRQLKVEVGESTGDGKFSINCLRCVGACGLAPVVTVGEKVFGRVAPSQVKQIIAEYREGRNSEDVKTA
ncbi:MAG: NAD(P)H-dependent oxidoreductase subunit E [Prolixibacteraceae bacterium]|jgi:NADP-reducing hydrogenase subunit HndA|nr:NAD(P)H-dependent oxidoreductase subunit E [Prolixibacteraceae bacterium]MBT6005615.1 NAD(P)H-dependent oxidoreductase subunit E [Prolixibacteraceae bacterium]MBT6766265.1 NAD(P)H-dependent oxidoreductase subunit E [Prolixibacteraceae bacterium]MBT6998782.1 NAD(P)H-dependent oxidoreductase subunit E [Prolixibacteraceae bacterium]MBT7396517.1 NAD(P)H-dependent oxidoreductase subunit E [Prolixibacteraceae bacterium]